MHEVAWHQPGKAGVIESEVAPLINAESRALVISERPRVVVDRGVDPDPLRRAQPRGVDRGLQKIAAKTVADEVLDQAEIGEFGISRSGAIQLEIAGGNAA